MDLFLQIVKAIHRILYATDDSPSVIAGAMEMISQHQQLEQLSNPISDVVDDDIPKLETQKRKNILTLEVDEAANSSLSPRQRLSDVSDVHRNGLPLMTF